MKEKVYEVPSYWSDTGFVNLVDHGGGRYSLDYCTIDHETFISYMPMARPRKNTKN